MRRRRFLGVVGTAGSALAGCISAEQLGGSTTADHPVTSGRAAWPTFGYDSANTGYDPDATGPTGDASVVWQFDAGSPTANTSPVVGTDAVYTGSSGTGGNLWALDVESGEQRWEFETKGWVNHAPALAGDAVYVGTDGQAFHAVDARTGEERWTTALERDLHDSSPTVADGTVYVGTAGDSPATASENDGEGVDRSGALFALDSETGERLWSFEVADWISTAPAVVDGLVYFGDDAGTVRALDAETGEERWSFPVGSPVFSSPTVANGTLYFGAAGRLYALDVATGEAYWTFDLRWPEVKSSPAVADGTVFVGCSGGVGCIEENCDVPEHTATLHAVDARHGAEAWKYEIDHDVRSSPAVADGVVYLGCAGGVSAVQAGSGREAWRVDFGSYVDSSPAIADGKVFVNCSDGNVYALG